MTGKKYTICLVGAGRMGSRWANIISKSTSAQLGAVVDVDQKRAQEISQLYNTVYSSTLDKALVGRCKIDAVFVVTPHAFLYQNARQALGLGCHVFIEKPGSTTVRQLKALRALARKKKRALMIGFNYRHFNDVSRAKKLVESGAIGKVLSIHLRHGHAGRPGYGKEWRMNKRLAGGGVLMDQGIHLIDLAGWFLRGEWQEVHGVVSNAFWKTKVEDSAVVLLRTREGLLASLAVSLTEWKPVFEMKIIGTKGYCVVNGVGRKYGGSEIVTIAKLKKDYTVSEREITCNPDPDICLHTELKIFIAAMKKRTPQLVNVDEAIKVLQVVQKIYS